MTCAHTYFTKKSIIRHFSLFTIWSLCLYTTTTIVDLGSGNFCTSMFSSCLKFKFVSQGQSFIAFFLLLWSFSQPQWFCLDCFFTTLNNARQFIVWPTCTINCQSYPTKIGQSSKSLTKKVSSIIEIKARFMIRYTHQVIEINTHTLHVICIFFDTFKS